MQDAGAVAEARVSTSRSLPSAARLAAINLGKQFDALAGLGLRLGLGAEPEAAPAPAPEAAPASIFAYAPARPAEAPDSAPDVQNDAAQVDIQPVQQPIGLIPPAEEPALVALEKSDQRAKANEGAKGSVVTLIQPSSFAPDARMIMAVVPSGNFVAANSSDGEPQEAVRLAVVESSALAGQEPELAEPAVLPATLAGGSHLAAPAHPIGAKSTSTSVASETEVNIRRNIPASRPPERQAVEPALLSPDTGAKVGAAFEALAGSLALRDQEMIERLAREMLRPMLKNWLDDNLPVVVERLVRAEIERVARGRSS